MVLKVGVFVFILFLLFFIVVRLRIGNGFFGFFGNGVNFVVFCFWDIGFDYGDGFCDVDMFLIWCW